MNTEILALIGLSGYGIWLFIIVLAQQFKIAYLESKLENRGVKNSLKDDSVLQLLKKAFSG